MAAVITIGDGSAAPLTIGSLYPNVMANGRRRSVEAIAERARLNGFVAKVSIGVFGTNYPVEQGRSPLTWHQSVLVYDWHKFANVYRLVAIYVPVGPVLLLH